MDYCHEQRKPLSEIISENITSLAGELTDSHEDETDPDSDHTDQSDSQLGNSENN
jgi:hypothetical protein